MSEMRRVFTMRRAVITVMVTREYLISDQMGYKRPLRDTNMVKRSLLESLRNNTSNVLGESEIGQE